MLQQEIKWFMFLAPPDDAEPVPPGFTLPIQGNVVLQMIIKNLVRSYYSAFGMPPPERGSVTIRWEREKTSPETSDASN